MPDSTFVSSTGQLTPEEVVAEVAAQYDNEEGDLTRSSLRRLEYRQRHSGKVCASCNEARPLSEFGPDYRKPDGLDPRCRKCEAARRKRERARAAHRVKRPATLAPLSPVAPL